MLHIAPDVIRQSALMSRVDEILAEARALRATMLKRIEQLDQTISTFERMKRDTPSEVLDQILQRGSGGAKAEEEAPGTSYRLAVTPSDVAELAETELVTRGHPMKRGGLVQALRAKGYRLIGKDANKNLGTILWRHPSKFVSIEGLGYWVKGVPLEGVYDPERDDEPLPKTTFVRRRP